MFEEDELAEEEAKAAAGNEETKDGSDNEESKEESKAAVHVDSNLFADDAAAADEDVDFDDE